MQLVAYGAQDIYLTGNPQITFFKVVYRRHTNFSMEAIEQTMNGTTSPTAEGQTATCTISRNGDLIHRVYVTTDSFPGTKQVDYDGSKLINEVELEIGGQRIDRHYTEWNQVWEELCTSESKALGLKSMKGDIGTRDTGAAATTGCKHLQIPLNFWFCRNVGLALPLIALQYHEVKLKFKWSRPSTDSASVKCNVIVDYIYLDTDERRRFAQVSHEYLIEQIQRFETTTPASANHSVDLNFNHPVKELIWTNHNVIQEAGTGKAQLKLNGHDRFSERPLEYFQIRQPYEYHTAVPRQNLPSGAQSTGVLSNVEDVLGTGVELNLVADAGTGASSGVDASSTTPLTGLGQGSFHMYEIASDGTTAPAALANGTTDAELALAFRHADFSAVGQALAIGDRLLIDVSGTAAGFGGGKRLFTVRAISAIASTGTAGTANTFLDFSAGTIADAFAQDPGTILLGLVESSLVSFIGGGGIATDLGSAVDAAARDLVFKIDSIEKISMGTESTNTNVEARTSKMLRKINVYSFGLKPEEHQPSGTCNFSRIDSAKLNFSGLTSTAGDRKINIYAVNYNVLRIMSGMGGLAYSN